MGNKEHKKFYLIREDVLPESVVKTLKIKEALKSNPKLSIYDAVKQYDLSRSAFYKYRDTIFPVDDKTNKRKEFTLILYVNDKVGLLADVLKKISELQLSVLTIHQSIPMDERATITVSLNASASQLSVDDVIQGLSEVPFVSEVDLISMSI